MSRNTFLVNEMMEKEDSNHNECTEDTVRVTSEKLLNCVREGNKVGVKYLLEQGEDVDAADEAGNTPLHLAVLGGHYNIAVMLLNHGCRLDLANAEGWTSLQLAHKHQTRTVFSIAIQLTSRNRAERENREKKRKLVIQNHEEQLNCDESEDEHCEENITRMLNNKLHASHQSLATAKKVVTDLEDQLVTARSLVNQLEMEVERLRSDVEKVNRKKQRGQKERKTISLEMLEPCSVCLELPRPPLKVFQCPEGHVFCEDCSRRPEMTFCPECRVSLEGVTIRNRTLEKLIRMAT